jgi:hypothetical protein
VSARRPQQPGHEERERRLPRAVRSGDGEGLARAHRHVDAVQRPGVHTGIAERDSVGAHQLGAEGRARRRRGRRRSGHPHAELREPRAVAREDVPRGAIRDDAAPGFDDDDAIDERQRIRDAMLDEHERHRAQLRERLAHGSGARRIEVGGRLVEQQQPRPQRERARDREALLLAPREGRGGAILRIGKVHLRERAMHARPDDGGGHAVVLEAERDVVAGTRHDDLRLGILEHDAGRVARVAWRASVDAELSL